MWPTHSNQIRLAATKTQERRKDADDSELSYNDRSSYSQKGKNKTEKKLLLNFELKNKCELRQSSRMFWPAKRWLKMIQLLYTVIADGRWEIVEDDQTVTRNENGRRDGSEDDQTPINGNIIAITHECAPSVLLYTNQIISCHEWTTRTQEVVWVKSGMQSPGKHGSTPFCRYSILPLFFTQFRHPIVQFLERQTSVATYILAGQRRGSSCS